MNQEYSKSLFLTENDSHVTLPSNLPAFYSIEASFGLVFRYYLIPYQPEIVLNTFLYSVRLWQSTYSVLSLNDTKISDQKFSGNYLARDG